MGRIAKRTEVGVMRRGDVNFPVRLQKAVKFFHGPDDVGNVLDDMDRANGVKAAIGKRVGNRSRSHRTSARVPAMRSMPIAPGYLFTPQPTSRTRPAPDGSD